MYISKNISLRYLAVYHSHRGSKSGHSSDLKLGTYSRGHLARWRYIISTRTGCPGVSIRRLVVLVSVYGDWLSWCQYTATGCPGVSIRRLVVLVSVYGDWLSWCQYTATGCPGVSIQRLVVLVSVYGDWLSWCQYTATG